MREIKFRGLTVSNEWVYGNLAVLSERYDQILPGSYISNNSGRPFAYLVRSETVGQFIGLTDKNDKEIYERDIVECFKCDDIDFRSIVKFKNGAFGYINLNDFLVAFSENYHFHWKNGQSNKIKVVGNVHENKD